MDSPPLKLKQGDYSNVVQSLAKVLSEDLDHKVSSTAANLLKKIVQGLGKTSETYSETIIRACLEVTANTVLFQSNLNSCICEAMKYLSREGLSTVAEDFSKALRSKRCASVTATKALTGYEFKNGCDIKTVDLIVSDLWEACNSNAVREVRESAIEAIASLKCKLPIIADSILALIMSKIKD